MPKSELIYPLEHRPELQTSKRGLSPSFCPGGCQQLARWGSRPLADNELTTASGIFGNFLVASVWLGSMEAFNLWVSLSLLPALSHSSLLLWGVRYICVLGSGCLGLKASCDTQQPCSPEEVACDLVVPLMSQQSFMAKIVFFLRGLVLTLTHSSASLVCVSSLLTSLGEVLPPTTADSCTSV